MVSLREIQRHARGLWRNENRGAFPSSYGTCTTSITRCTMAPEATSSASAS